MSMDINKARQILDELGSVLGDHYAEATRIVLDDHERLIGSRNARTGAREAKIMDYMAGVPGVPISPDAVRHQLGLTTSPAPAMANLADKGRLQRLGKAALYMYVAGQR